MERNPPWLQGRVAAFLGTSRNAVWTQIWTALIAILILKYMQLRAQYGWSFSKLLAMVRFSLFTHRDLMTWLHAPFDVLAEPPGGVQYSIQFTLHANAAIRTAL